MRQLSLQRRKGLDKRVLHRVRRFLFRVSQPVGVHITRNVYHSPIPDTRELPEQLWQVTSELPGVDMREAQQLALLEDFVEQFGEEFLTLETEPLGTILFRMDNGSFGSVDAEILYAMVRHHRPHRIIEVGSGWSTLVSLKALQANAREGGRGHFTACEPYPSPLVLAVAENHQVDLQRLPVQSISVAAFEELAEGDILFIDSSHVCKVGSDVQYELLEVLPRLRPGVLVHIHDIFLPEEYPREWLLDEQWFWNEQYVLQAFLCFNSEYEVLWSSSHMRLRHPELLESSIQSYDRTTRRPCSLWIRRVSRSATSREDGRT
jgi:predicted O-methyltransferase YrrM